MSTGANVYTCSEITTFCTLQDTIYGYYPSLPANAFFLSIFSVLFLANIYLSLHYRTWTYGLALTCGCFVEAVGYIGRLLLHQNPFSDDGFTMQICCLIMGPAWLAISIYLTLKHVVKAYGEQYSYLKARYYTWLFIAGDAFSLSLQAAGGGLASGAKENSNQTTTGNNLAIIGIIMQVVTLAIFAGLAALFFGRRHLALRNQRIVNSEPEFVQPPQTLRFKLFLVAVTIAFLTIFIRCVYRIAEMIGGWSNPFMQNEVEFIVLDSVMCTVAAIALSAFHPGWCFPQMAQPISFGKRKLLSTSGENGKIVEDSVSASESDVDVEKTAVARPHDLYFR